MGFKLDTLVVNHCIGKWGAQSSLNLYGVLVLAVQFKLNKRNIALI